MAKRKRASKLKRRSKKASIKAKPKLPEAVLAQLHEQRRRLFKATGVISCVRFASDSMICDGEPDIVDGLAAALDILGDVDDVLEELIPSDYGLRGDDD